MKGNIVWKRHLSLYKSDLGYTIRSPQRGSQYTLVLPNGNLWGRYPKLYQAKEAAEKYEAQVHRDKLGVGAQGHEIFTLMGRQFDVTVATEVAQERGEAHDLVVSGYFRLLQKNLDDHRFTMGISVNQEHVPTVDLEKPLIVAQLTTRGGDVNHMVIDGWHRIAKAEREGRDTLPCLLLSIEDTQLITVN